MDITGLKRDSAKVEAGQWVGDIPDMGTMKVKVRGLGSNAYEQVLTRKRRALDRTEKQADGSPTPEALDRIMGEAIHDAVLLDWSGLEDAGKAVKYDEDLALTWLTDPDFRPFKSAVIWAALQVDNAKAETAKALEKN